MSSETTGYIKTNAFPGQCGEAYGIIKQIIESARVHFPTAALTGFLIQTTEPGADDRDKLWVKDLNNFYYWYYWNTGCGKWCPMLGAPGDRITRHRIEETVAADIDKYYGCGWELADGSNILGVDLRKVGSNRASVYALALEAPTFCVETIVSADSGGTETTYNGLGDGTKYVNLTDLVESLNAEFTLSAIPLTASVINDDTLKITHDTATHTIISALDCDGRELLRVS